MLAKDKDLKKIIFQLSWNHPESLFYTIEVKDLRLFEIEGKLESSWKYVLYH